MDSRTARITVMPVGDASSNGRDKTTRKAFKVGMRVCGEKAWENSAKESSDMKPSGVQVATVAANRVLSNRVCI
jgi:hypothetical protein